MIEPVESDKAALEEKQPAPGAGGATADVRHPEEAQSAPDDGSGGAAAGVQRPAEARPAPDGAAGTASDIRHVEEAQPASDGAGGTAAAVRRLEQAPAPDGVASAAEIRRHTGRPHKDRTILWIAAFKLVKAALLVAVAVGAIRMLHHDVADTMTRFIEAIRVDPGNRIIHKALMKAGGLNDRKLEEISFGSFVYAALLLTEGLGLMLRKRWAEYFTIIMTTSLMPLEIYEIIERLTFTRVVVLLVNAAIVWYLIVRLRRERTANHLQETLDTAEAGE